MTERSSADRRTVLKGIGALATLSVAGVSGVAAESESRWRTVKSPVDAKLFDVVETSDGLYAVGGGGVILARDGDTWRVVRRGGPTGNGNDLYGASVTDDGDRLWVAGASGAVGEYDVTTDTLFDHSAPDGSTNNFNDVAVTGPADDANVYIAGDSGALYYNFDDGEAGEWDDTTPGSGAALPAIDFYGPRSGVAVDTNGAVFRTDDGTTWNRIGIENANVNFYGVDADAADDVTVSGGNGVLQAWNGASWTKTDVGDAGLRDVTVDGTTGYTVGGGGVVFAADGDEWTRERTPTGSNLSAVVDADTAVAVGASGTIIERDG